MWSSGFSSTCRCSTANRMEVQEESVAAYRRLLTEAPAGAAATFEEALEVGAGASRADRPLRPLSASQPDAGPRPAPAEEEAYLRRRHRSGSEKSAPLRSAVPRVAAGDECCRSSSRCASSSSTASAAPVTFTPRSRIEPTHDPQARQRMRPATAILPARCPRELTTAELDQLRDHGRQIDQAQADRLRWPRSSHLRRPGGLAALRWDPAWISPFQIRARIESQLLLHLLVERARLRRVGRRHHHLQLNVFIARRSPGRPRPRSRNFWPDWAPAGMCISTRPPRVGTVTVAPKRALPRSDRQE